MGGAPLRLLCSLFALTMLIQQAAAAPQIGSLPLPALRSGETTTLTINGSGLLPQPQLVLDVPVAKQTLLEGAQPGKIQIEVTLAKEVPAGIYPLRVVSGEGISNAVPVAIDPLPQLPFAPQVEQLPVTLHGNLTGSTILNTQFPGKQGQQLVVEVEAQRLGGKLNPALRLFAPDGRQLAQSLPTRMLHGDSRLMVVLPQDGEYQVQLFDVEYRGAAPGNFRLKLGDLAFADLTYPLGVRGQAASLELHGHVPDGTRVDLTLSAAGTPQPAAVPSLPNLSGPRPPIMVSDWPQYADSDSAESPQPAGSAPLGISGRLSQRGEEDVFRVEVKPGSKHRVEVRAARLGSPLDGVLFVRRENGGQIATNDDHADTTDPGLDLNVPGDASAVLIAIKDLHGRGGEDFLYHVSITPSGQRPPFELSLDSDRFNVPQNGSALVKVVAQRNGYNGPIQLACGQLPEGLQLAGNSIPAGATQALVTLSAAGSPGNFAVTELTGTAEGGDASRQLATVKGAILPDVQPWLSRELALAIAPAAAFQVALGSPSLDKLAAGGSLQLPVKVTRQEGQAAGPLRLSLLTSQVVPVIADGNDKGKPDQSKALRADAVELTPEQAESTLSVTIPSDLAMHAYDLAVKAELLSADKKKVLATVSSPAVRLEAIRPLAVELTSPAEAKVRAGAGETDTLKGKLTRLEGFDKDVTLSLSGLPKDVMADEVTVPAGQSEFAFELRLTGNAKAGELKGVKLVASLAPNAEQPEAVIRSQPIPLKLQVLAGE